MVKFAGIIIGQMFALIHASMGLITEYLLILGIETPLFQLSWGYLLLFLVFFVKTLTIKEPTMPWKSIWKFIIITIFDSQANFLMVLSFQYTSIVSVLCITNLTVVPVLVLSYIFLKKKVTPFEILGSLMALTGLGCIIISDIWANNWIWGGNFYGDLIAIGCMLSFAMEVINRSNTNVEYIMSQGYQNSHFLCILGIFGAGLTMAESLVWEMHFILKISRWEEVLLLSGFALLVLLGYSFLPLYVMKYGATMFNLSLLTSVFYGLAIGIFLFSEEFSWLYAIGFILVVLGLVIYNKPSKKKSSDALLI